MRVLWTCRQTQQARGVEYEKCRDKYKTQSHRLVESNRAVGSMSPRQQYGADDHLSPICSRGGSQRNGSPTSVALANWKGHLVFWTHREAKKGKGTVRAKGQERCQHRRWQQSSAHMPLKKKWPDQSAFVQCTSCGRVGSRTSQDPCRSMKCFVRSTAARHHLVRWTMHLSLCAPLVHGPNTPLRPELNWRRVISNT